MNVYLDDWEFKVDIERKNNKNIYFRFKEDGTLHVTCNRFVSEREIKRIIEKNKDSLLRMWKKVRKINDNNKQFHYLGEPLTKVFDDSFKGIRIEEGMLYAKNERTFNSWYKKECLRVFQERISAWLGAFKDIPEFSLRIREMKTRWGVNNVSKRIITLNSLLLQKEIKLIDYVIVHELCHFYEANHSVRFWEQVEKRYPDYKLARKLLRS